MRILSPSTVVLFFKFSSPKHISMKCRDNGAISKDVDKIFRK